MTDFIKLLNQRQSCRSFSDKKVEDEKIIACINAASLAPSACNTQPYHFYIAHTPESVAAVAEFAKFENLNQWVDTADAFVVITQEHADIPARIHQVTLKDFRQYDIGLAIENFCLEATELGIGTCILGAFNEEKLKEKLRITSCKKIALLIALGYPENNEIRTKKRKPLEDVITYLK